MIEKLYGPIKAGQSVNLQLTFAHAGQLLVTAPVIGVTAPAPTRRARRCPDEGPAVAGRVAGRGAG